MGDKKQKGGWSVNKSKKIQRCLEQNWIKSVFIYLEQPQFCWIKKKRQKKVDKRQIKPVFYLDKLFFVWCNHLPQNPILEQFFWKKICERRFFFINRHVKHTFVHYEYVEVPLGLAKHIAGQDLMHRPLPADIIWLEFGSFSNFLREKFGFIQKMADLANLAGRLADVTDFIWTVWTFSVERILKSRVVSKTRWDNAIFVTDLLPEN